VEPGSFESAGPIFPNALVGPALPFGFFN